MLQTETTNRPLGLADCAEYNRIARRVQELKQEKLERERISEAEERKLRVEFLRFFSLKFVTEETISPSPHVDEFWHAFILHTRDYMNFCQRHLGYYLHHEPRDHTKVNATRDSTPGLRTKALIDRLYPERDGDIWAETAICSNSHCDDIRRD